MFLSKYIYLKISAIVFVPCTASCKKGHAKTNLGTQVFLFECCRLNSAHRKMTKFCNAVFKLVPNKRRLLHLV